jgi:hypothetical protein
VFDNFLVHAFAPDDVAVVVGAALDGVVVLAGGTGRKRGITQPLAFSA